MKRIVTFISALFALCCTLPAQTGQDAQPASRLSRDSILIGDQVIWSVPISIKDGESAMFVQPDEPVAPGVETIIPFHVDTIAGKHGNIDLEGRMTITSFDSGSFFMPPVIAMVARGGSVDTIFYDGPVLEVNTIPVDTATFQLYDIKGQKTYPLRFGEVFPWVLLVIAAGFAVWAVIRFIRNRRNNRDFFGRLKVSDPPHIVALRDLEKIRGQKLWQNNKQKQFYSAVTDVLRRYMAGRYEFPAMEQTSAEIFENLKGREIDGDMLESIKQLFSTSDFVKFAKHTATDTECEEAIPTAVRFVNATFEQQLVEEKKEEE